MTCLDDAIVLGLVEGRLPAATLAAVDEHIDSCSSCRDVVTLVASSRAPGHVLARGETLGRFVIGELLGSGAMGRVYSAWEPELDRRVAIKVLLEDGGGARERLVREAQAMARLNHPNIVTVHEVGTTDAGVYVVMELVDGDSLRAWTAERRPWREVVRVLVEIARGLAAVHAAGVVHRDVKPDNMIVGADGRVRLGDFGLARSGAKPAHAQLALGTDTTVAGTPAYMAPELLRGGAASAASDQFSFGVMAYELLAGRRPYAGATWAQLLAAIERGEVPPLRDVPGWLAATVQRCLAADPARRFASMQAVADHLAHQLARKRPTRWLAAALATAVAASGATFAWTRTDDDRIASCAITAEQVGWSPEQRARFGFLGQPALAAIDRWASTWTVERVDVCRAARVGASARVAARERCLDTRRAELAALLARLDRSTASHAIDALATLAPPLDCRGADIDAADPLPLDPERATAAREVRTALPGLRAAIAVGDTQSAVSRADELVARATASEHAPTLADALLARADALRAVDRLADAATAARDAVAAALRGRADTTAARGWLVRVAIAGDRRDLAAADDLGAVAHAAIERAGAPPHLAATLARLRGLVAYNRGRLDEARTLLEAARAQLVALSGPRSLDVAIVESALGSVARQAGQLDEAERRHRAALAIDRALRGEAHRDIARDLHNVAGVLRLRGDLDGALVHYRKALEIELATQGEGIAAGLTHNSIGLVLIAQQQWDLARVELVRARDLLTAADHGDRAFAEHNLGLVAQATGDHRAALAHFDRAAAIYATTIGADADAATRLVEDRATSLAALRPRPRPAPRPQPPATAPAKPAQSKRDVGVYGSAQSW